MEVRQLFEKLGSQNQQLTCFAGYGVYDHYMPSVIPSLLQRSEFLTSYTPYQAEISQGTLHYIFEYQSMMAELTGMDIISSSFPKIFSTLALLNSPLTAANLMSLR